MEIYLITNRITGQFYVGKARNHVDRFEQHKRNSADQTKGIGSLAKNMRQHGVDNFSIEILEICGDEEAVWRERETFWIRSKYADDPDRCLNLISFDGSAKRPIKEVNSGRIFNSAAEAANEWGLDKKDVYFSCREKIGLGNLNDSLKSRLNGRSFMYVYLTPEERERQAKKEAKKKERAKKTFKKPPTGLVKRKGGPRSRPVLCLTNGKIYRDAKTAHAELLKNHPTLKYSDVVQGLRDKTWPKLEERLGILRFEYAKKYEGPVWTQSPVPINQMSPETLRKYARKNSFRRKK